MDKATDGVVAAPEAVFGCQVLVDALGAQALIALGLDDLPPRLAVARTTMSPAAIVTGRSEQRTISIRRDLGAIRAGGRNGWFWRCSGQLEVACDGLAIDVQLARDSTLQCSLSY